MDSATFRVFWIGTCAATGLAVVIALLSTVGTLPRWSLICLVTLGGFSFSFTAVGLGWASLYPTNLKSVIILCGIWIVMGIFGFVSWPRVDKTKPIVLPAETYLQFTRTALYVDPSLKKAFVIDRPATVNMTVQNTSSVGVARAVFVGGGLAFIAPGKDIETMEEDNFKEFRSAWVPHAVNAPGQDLGAGANTTNDIPTKPLSKDLIEGLEREEVYLYFFGVIKWTDDTGTWETQSCSHLLVKRSNVNTGVAVWRQCESGARHNFIRHPFQVKQD